jgi:adenine specific DNA methylase Mod
MAKKDYSNLTKDQLLEVIEKLEGKKKYGLVWDEERVPEKVVTDCQDKLPVLTEVKGKEIITDENEPTHILIEGDNYHALSVLNYTHKGKVDLIYIDPPYNTGNKDFTYNDKYVEKEDTWRHSKWLTFMSKRLELAKDLLAEKGVIFISIDDNEIAQLKLLCDAIFGEQNFVANCVRRRRKTQANLAKNIAPVHEYLLIYSKSIDQLNLNKLSYSEEFIKKGFANPDNDPNELKKLLKGIGDKITIRELKYFKTSFVANNRNKDQLKIDITKRCTEMLCLKEGIFNLIKEEADYKIFQQGNRYLAVYYDFANASLDELKEEMNALKGEKVLYCFTVDNHGLDKANFRGWKNIRLEPIPQKILDVYKRIFKN